MSIDFNSVGKIVFKSSADGDESHAINLVCPTSMTANRNITFPDVDINTSLSLCIQNVFPVQPDIAHLVVDDSYPGTIFFIPTMTTECDITLPAAQIGLEYTFIMTDTATFAVRIAGEDSAVINGNVNLSDEDNPATAIVSVNNNRNTVRFNETAVVGDYVKLYCDGAKWHVTGQSADADGIEFINV